MKITSQDIQKLRQATGIGILDCKKALLEAQGDFEKAMEVLKQKGQHKAMQRADKATTEGIVCADVSEDATCGVIIALSCETDFVAKNAAFQELAQQILAIALRHTPPHSEALMELAIGPRTIRDQITDMMAKMGEKIALTHYVTLLAHRVIPYIHQGSRLGVLVGLQGSNIIQEVGLDIAMQIAAMQPTAVDAQPHTELEIPAKDTLLLHQPFIKDTSLNVAQYLAKVAPGLHIHNFHRITVDA